MVHPPLDAWFLGYYVTAGAIAIVVALVATALTLLRRISVHLREISAAMDPAYADLDEPYGREGRR